MQSLPGLILPSLSAGPSGMMDAIKIPRSNFPVLSSPTIINPVIKGSIQYKYHAISVCLAGNKIHSLPHWKREIMHLLQKISLPKPCF